VKYNPGIIPISAPSNLRAWLAEELRRISNAVGPAEFAQLEPIDVEPAKPRKGMMVWAVGTNWDPGSGEGAYIYNGSTWDKVN